MNKSISNKGIWVVLLMGIILAGCSVFSKDVVTTPMPEPVPGMARLTQFYRAMPPAEGSLWTDSVGVLFVDRRAKQVGDTIIIDIVENASSQMDVNTETKRESGINVDVPAMTGAAWSKGGLVSSCWPSWRSGARWA